MLLTQPDRMAKSSVVRESLSVEDCCVAQSEHQVLANSGTPYVEFLGVDQNLVRNQVKISRRQEVVLPLVSRKFEPLASEVLECSCRGWAP